jgi:hypothetical protein
MLSGRRLTVLALRRALMAARPVHCSHLVTLAG